MKKVGIIVFIISIAVGLLFANLFSFGKASGKLFNFSFNRSVEGSGVVVSESRSVSDFKEIRVSGVFIVDVVSGKDFQIEVSADDNLLPLIETHVEDGILRIRSKESIRSGSPLRVRVHAPAISTVEASGAARVDLSEFKNTSLNVDASGASKISVSGSTETLRLDVSGASKIEASNLNSKSCDISASGASTVEVSVSEKLDANASGASRISYSGSPSVIEERSSGASRISPK